MQKQISLVPLVRFYYSYEFRKNPEVVAKGRREGRIDSYYLAGSRFQCEVMGVILKTEAGGAEKWGCA